MLQLCNKKGKEMYKKVCCTIRPYDLFLPFSLSSPFKHYTILFFVGVNYKYINESFAFSPGLISMLYIQVWVFG